MPYEPIFSALPKASATDRALLFTTAQYCCALSEKARREGILALEENLPYTCDEHITLPGGETPFATEPVLERFIVRLLHLVLDGHDNGFVGVCARYALSATTARDGVVLASMIAAEGICAVQRGDSPYSVCDRLSFMLGFPLCDEFLAECEEEPFLLRFLAFPPLPDEAHWKRYYSAEFDKARAEYGDLPKPDFSDIARIDDRGIQLLLRCIDSDELVTALIPPESEAVREAVFRNMSEQAAKLLRYDMATHYPHKGDVCFESQIKIAHTLHRLIEAGEIDALSDADAR